MNNSRNHQFNQGLDNRGLIPVPEGLDNDMFSLIAQTRKQVTQITQKAKNVVKQFYKNPDDLSAFIERHGTPVYVINSGLIGLVVLKLLKIEPGFVPFSTNTSFRTLTSLLDKYQDKPGCNYANGLFILTPSLYNIGFMTHQLHHWLSARNGLQGYDDESQALYREFWLKHRGLITRELLEMDVDALGKIRIAINRDLEALKFLREVAYEIITPANQSSQLKAGKARA